MITLNIKHFDFTIRCSDCGCYTRDIYNITNNEGIAIYLCSDCYNVMMENLKLK